eukprot:scaffold166079_cov28-Tisochrysis_lutea.AAC.1
MEHVHTSRLVSLLQDRAAAYLQMAALSFGSPRSKMNFELAGMDANAILELDASMPQAFLIRARTSIALACSAFANDATESDLRLEDASRDLNAVKSQGTAARSQMEVHAANMWEKAARTIAERFTITAGLPFPNTASDAVLLAMRLECDPGPPKIMNTESGNECESGATKGFLWADLKKHFRTSSLWLLAQRDNCHIMQVVILQCFIGSVLAASLLVHKSALGDLVPFSIYNAT